MAGKHAAPGPVPAAPPGLFAQTVSDIAKARYGVAPARPAAGGGTGGPFVTRQNLKAQIGPVPGPVAAIKTVGGAISGAMIATLLIGKVFPHNRTETAIATGVLSAILAAASPVGSLAEDVGLGGLVGAGVWLALRMTGQIPAPADTAAVDTTDTAPAAPPAQGAVWYDGEPYAA